VHDVALAELLAHQRPSSRLPAPRARRSGRRWHRRLDTLPVDDPLFAPRPFTGGQGEDGTVQRMMEQRGIAFHRLRLRRQRGRVRQGRAKEMVRGRLRVAEWRVARDPRELAASRARCSSADERVVLKPVAGGSSRGCSSSARGDAIPRPACRTSSNIPAAAS